MSSINLPMYVQATKKPHLGYACDNAAQFIIFDTITNAVVYTSPNTLPGGCGFALVVSKDNKLVFGAGDGGLILRIKAADRTFITAAVGSNNQGVACNADGSLVYAIDTTGGFLYKRNGTTLAAIDVAGPYVGPRCVITSTDDAKLYVGDGTTSLERIDAVNWVALTAIANGAQFGACRSKDGTRVYGSATGLDAVQVVRTSDDTIIRTIALAGGASPRGICVSDDGTRVYVACNGTGTVTVLNPVAGSPIVATPAVPSADKVALSPDGKWLYVTDGSGSLTIINALSNTVTGSIVGGIGNLAGLATEHA